MISGETIKPKPNYAEQAKKIKNLNLESFGQGHYTILNIMERENINMYDAAAKAVSGVSNDNDEAGKTKIYVDASEDLKGILKELGYWDDSYDDSE